MSVISIMVAVGFLVGVTVIMTGYACVLIYNYPNEGEAWDMSFNPLIPEEETIRIFKNIPPDDGCEYCESGWCKNPWGYLCPHFIGEDKDSGGCEKAL